MDENRRNFSRVKFKSTAFIKYKQQSVQVDLLDISLKGALISSDTLIQLDKGEPCLFELRLNDSEIVMTINAHVVYKLNENLGLKFDNIDLESMIHLRRLVELNVGNPDQIQKELFFLAATDK